MPKSESRLIAIRPLLQLQYALSGAILIAIASPAALSVLDRRPSLTGSPRRHPTTLSRCSHNLLRPS